MAQAIKRLPLFIIFFNELGHESTENLIAGLTYNHAKHPAVLYVLM